MPQARYVSPVPCQRPVHTQVIMTGITTVTNLVTRLGRCFPLNLLMFFIQGAMVMG